MSRCVFRGPAAVIGWDRSWFEPAPTAGRPLQRESLRALMQTGAVGVRWDREQLIGGQPTEACK